MRRDTFILLGVLVTVLCVGYFSYGKMGPSPDVDEPSKPDLPSHLLEFISDRDNCRSLKEITGVQDLVPLPDSPELRRINEPDDNGQHIEQDDPALLHYIWDHCDVLMRPPDGKPTTYTAMGASMGQDEIVRTIYKNMTGGFFLEVGAYDGVTSSNTLELERDLGWKGILIEAGKTELAKLHKHHRNAWISHSCVSVHKYPHEVIFQPIHGGTGKVSKVLDEPGSQPSDSNTKSGAVKMQCFPLYTYLAALNVKVLDFLSLDVEGLELQILKTIPFDKILIKVVAVEIVTSKEGQGPYIEFMEANGFRTLGLFYDAWKPFDLIFVHKSLAVDVAVLDLLRPKKEGRYNH